MKIEISIKPSSFVDLIGDAPVAFPRPPAVNHARHGADDQHADGESGHRACNYATAFFLLNKVLEIPLTKK